MEKPHVLVIPYPAQGHVIPIMELALRLVEQGVKVTFINTDVNHRLLTSTLSEKHSVGDLMHMVSIPDGLEPWEDRSDLTNLTRATLKYMPSKGEELMEKINKEDNSKVTCVLADANLGWATKVAKKMGIKRAVFWPTAAAILAHVLSSLKLNDDGNTNENGLDHIIQQLPSMPSLEPEHQTWASVDDLATTALITEQAMQTVEATTMTEWIVVNSTYELEPAAFTLYPKLLPVGPLLASNRLADQAGHFWQEDITCLTWLDQQQEGSVMYIAFGSTTIFNQTQFQELALGLEHSNKPFLWVVRTDMTTETTVTYPDGYMDRIGTRAKIVNWAPQQKVLAHRSVACFLSHCGWNSTLEGVTNGVPFLCWPHFCDHFTHRTYIRDNWKNGLGFDKNEAGIITRGEIKSKVEQLLSDKTFKANALKFKEEAISSVRKGGLSQKNLSNFIDWIKEKDM